MSDDNKVPDVDPLNAEPIVRRRMTMLYLVDASGSMMGSKIGTVNNTMTETIPEIRDIGGADSEVFINVMTFDSRVNWMYEEPINIEDFKWNDVETFDMTFLGAACIDLNTKLSKDAFMRSPHLSYAPVIILMSDGEPNDDYYGGLEVLKGNRWFKNAIKIAVAIGNDANKEKLADFTGDMELVMEVHNPDDLKRAIRFASITSSQIGSQSVGIGGIGDPISPDEADDAKQNQVKSKMKQFKQSSAMQAKDIDYDDWERFGVLALEYDHTRIQS